MSYFEYNKSETDTKYYEILETLMERWEYKLSSLKKPKAAMTQTKPADISQQSVMRQICANNNTVGAGFGVSEEQKTKTKKIVGIAYK